MDAALAFVGSNTACRSRLNLGCYLNRFFNMLAHFQGNAANVRFRPIADISLRAVSATDKLARHPVGRANQCNPPSALHPRH